MENKIKLKPCPFCGGEAVIVERIIFSWVECTKCKKVNMLTEDTTEKAAKIWNRRIKIK